MVRLRIKATGVVQGVGFRPFIHQLAEKLSLKGWVLNSPSGVLIEIEGEETDNFLEELRHNHPPLAVLEQVEIEKLSPVGYPDFQIRSSVDDEEPITLIPPDVATCPDCLREMRSIEDRRYRYPFLNCTNCGPRFTIIESLPYDRPNTTMKEFVMCPDCQREYDDIHDRRYNAQPIACPNCGPHLELKEKDNLLFQEEALKRAVDLLKEGKTLAIKGLGGFHLACDATNEKAVLCLRERKRRPHKSLAVMVSGIEQAEEFAEITPSAREALLSFRRPIVILKRKDNSPLAPSLSPDNPDIGVMLPYTPLHHLLMDNFSALVMTSANESGEPILAENREAEEKLSSIADAFLWHNRRIAQKIDDSVLQGTGKDLMMVRRARGYAPSTFKLWKKFPSILALGADLKNTFALTKRDYLFLSHHIGDLGNWESFQHLKSSLEHLESLYKISPQIVVHDLHPGYLTSSFAQALEGKKYAIQHHHAHIASVLFEAGVFHPVIGVACDGTGYGEDGAVWGMEFLEANLQGFQRRAHLDYVPLLGNEAAIINPWRMATSHLLKIPGGLELAQKLFPGASPDWLSLKLQWEKGFNSPLTSSAGRLFDTVSAICGFHEQITYEGQAAIRLEKMARETSDWMPLNFPLREGDPLLLDPTPLIEELVYYRMKGVDPCVLALSFHHSFALGIRKTCLKIREACGLNQVALSGGVFQNSLLLGLVLESLKNEGFEVLLPHQLPVNDGAISVGQVAVACARMEDLCA